MDFIYFRRENGSAQIPKGMSKKLLLAFNQEMQGHGTIDKVVAPLDHALLFAPTPQYYSWEGGENPSANVGAREEGRIALGILVMSCHPHLSSPSSDIQSL